MKIEMQKRIDDLYKKVGVQSQNSRVSTTLNVGTMHNGLSHTLNVANRTSNVASFSQKNAYNKFFY